MTFELDEDALAEAIRPQLEAIGEQIIVIAAAGYRFSENRDPSSFSVQSDDDGVRVAATGKQSKHFAHLDEWGSIRSRPTGAMRNAAARFGRFEPTPKP